jgi:hypothetical protein
MAVATTSPRQDVHVPSLTIDHPHRPFRITRPGKGLLGGDFINAREIGAGKIHIECADIFLQIFAPFCTGNWHDVVALCQHPGERKLRRRTLLFAGDRRKSLDQIEIALKNFALKSRRRAPIIIVRQILRFLDFSSQKSAAERAEWHETDAKLTANTENFLFGIARPE